MTRIAAALIACIVVSVPLSAQTTARSTEALTVLGACSAAVGADPMAELIAEGEITSPHPTIAPRSVTLKSKGIDHVRAETVAGRERRIHIVNRRRAVLIEGGRTQKLAGQNARHYPPDHLPGLFCRADLLPPDFHVRYGGLAEVNGRAAHEIVFFAADDERPGGRSRPLRTGMYVYLDAQTFIVVKAAFLIFSPDAIENHSLMEVFYEDYRLVDGMAIPHRIRRVVSGREFETMTFRSVRRATVSDTEFEEGMSR